MLHTSVDDPGGLSNLGAHVGLEPFPQVGVHLPKIEQCRVSGNGQYVWNYRIINRKILNEIVVLIIQGTYFLSLGRCCYFAGADGPHWLIRDHHVGPVFDLVCKTNLISA
jgi:hypothetical protein